MTIPGNLDGLGYRGKTVVVTGGASGMGEATARILSELGADVHVVDIQQPSAANAWSRTSGSYTWRHMAFNTPSLPCASAIRQHSQE